MVRRLKIIVAPDYLECHPNILSVRDVHWQARAED